MEIKSPEPGCCKYKICSIDDWGFFIMGFGRYKKSRS